MVVLEPQLRAQLQQALAELNRGLAASTKSRDLVEHLLGDGAGGSGAQPASVGIKEANELFIFENESFVNFCNNFGNFWKWCAIYFAQFL